MKLKPNGTKYQRGSVSCVGPSLHMYMYIYMYLLLVAGHNTKEAFSIFLLETQYQRAYAMYEI